MIKWEDILSFKKGDMFWWHRTGDPELIISSFPSPSENYISIAVLTSNRGTMDYILVLGDEKFFTLIETKK